MNLEKKKGAGIVSTLCAKMGATKKLGEISIPGNSTTTPGSQKSLAFPTFFGKQKIFFVCVRVGCRLCLSSGGILSCFCFFLFYFSADLFVSVYARVRKRHECRDCRPCDYRIFFGGFCRFSIPAEV